jgi:hypothetical protein
MMDAVISTARRSLSRWRSRGPSRFARVCWSLILLAGYGGWTWTVYEWATEHGYQALLDGYHPWYFAVSALTYWPAAFLLWWCMFTKAGGLVPWRRD